MDIHEVSPESVEKLRDCRKKDILYQMGRLQREGQIEPIPVIPTEDGTFILDQDHPDYWAHSPEQVEAAISLEWPTILVTY